MNPKEISLALSLVLPCAPVTAATTLTVPVARQPVRLPNEKPDSDHPPHGEGSGELPTFAGISASGAMANVNAIVTTISWEPLPSIVPDPADHFSVKHAQRHVLKLALVTPRRPLPRIRRSC